MKKSFISALYAVMCVAGGAVCLSSCSRGDASDEANPPIELQSYSYDVISEFVETDSLPSDAPGARYWRSEGSGVLPVKVGTRDITALRDSLCHLAMVEFPSEKVAAPIISSDRRITDQDPAKVEACSYASHTLSIVLANPRLIVWSGYNAYYICMAAHGMYATNYINYDIAGNRILELNDLMTEGYAPKLTALLRERLADRDDLIVSADEIGIPAEFMITPTGITFVYGLYEIAPYASGEVSVDLSCYDMEDILRPEAMTLITGSDASL